MESPKGSVSYELAEKAQQKLDKFQKLSDYEIGKLYYANVEQIELEEASVKTNDMDESVNTENGVAKNDTVATTATNNFIPSYGEDKPNSEANTEQIGNKVDKTPENVSVGDVFKDTKTGNIITVVERGAESTTIEIDTGAKTETRAFSNNRADSLVTSEQFEQVGRENTAPKNITLTRIGDFYEAFGDEAVEIADKLNLTVTPKTINGKRVQMVGFPVLSLIHISEPTRH